MKNTLNTLNIILRRNANKILLKVFRISFIKGKFFNEFEDCKIIGNKKIMLIKPYRKNTAKAYANSYKNLIIDIIDFILTSIYGVFEILKNVLELLICIIIGILNVLINTIATIIDFLPLIIINKGE